MPEFLLVPNGIRRREIYRDGRSESVALARQYLEALECGPAGDELAQFFARELILEIFPGKFFPNGGRDDFAGILAAAGSGEKVMPRQKYEIRNKVPAAIK